MKTTYLFPHSFKKFGWIALGLALLGAVAYAIYAIDLEYVDKFNQAHGSGGTKRFLFEMSQSTAFISQIISIIGLQWQGLLFQSAIILSMMMVVFSRERHEDEYVSKLRCDSLVWAFIASFLCIVVSFIFFAVMPSYHFMIFSKLFFIFFCPWVILILFFIKFKFALRKFYKTEEDEKQD